MNTRRDDDDNILDICLTFFCNAVWIFTWFVCLLPLIMLISITLGLARLLLGD